MSVDMPGSYRASTISGSSLQATLATGSATADPPPLPHHPLCCQGRLAYHETGLFECEHAAVGPDDPRTRFAVDQSVAMLILECAAHAD